MKRLSPRGHRYAVIAVVLLGFSSCGSCYMTTLTSYLRMFRCESFSFNHPDPYCRPAQYWLCIWLVLTGAAVVVGLLARVRRPRNTPDQPTARSRS